MPRGRNPNREKAKQIWIEHEGNITNRQIAQMLGENERVVAVWKQRDEWKVVQQTTAKVEQQTSNVAQQTKRYKGGAPRGNKNALGNRGGHGGPFRNKKALKTGEYETIWLDTLDDEERSLYEQINTDPLAQIEEQLRMLSLRERRMLLKIQQLKNGLSDKQRRVLQERKARKDVVQVHDEKSGQVKVVPVNREELVITEVEETEFRVIDDILKLEEALTRIQEKKLRAIETKSKLDESQRLLELRLEEQQLRILELKAKIARITGEEEPTEDDGFMEALRDQVSEVWADEEHTDDHTDT